MALNIQYFLSTYLYLFKASLIKLKHNLKQPLHDATNVKLYFDGDVLKTFAVVFAGSSGMHF